MTCAYDPVGHVVHVVHTRLVVAEHSIDAYVVPLQLAQYAHTRFVVGVHGTVSYVPGPHTVQVTHARSLVTLHALLWYEPSGQRPVEHGAQTRSVVTVHAVAA
jgi:hypothetical protein